MTDGESPGRPLPDEVPPGSVPAARPVVRILGEFAATVEGVEVPLGGPRQRAVLARILAEDGDAVSAEQIVDEVWGERSAVSRIASVHSYVSRLRRLLGAAAIPRRGGRYLLDRRVVTVDADLFVEEVTRGRRALALGEDDAAAAVLDAALARWSGPSAFGGMRDLGFVAASAARLEEIRVGAAEALADVRFRRGRAAEDITLLGELAQRDPLRESVALRLVRALYAVGRQADALAAFERCRRGLSEQLGVDPTPALRRMHAAVLAQEAVPVAAATVLPTNVPPRNRSFVGREELLDRIGTALDDDTHRPRAVVLVGLAGVGKTELATELAHRRHREGRVVWWVAAEDPAGTATGLADLAVALGIAAFERGEDTRAALWAELDRTPGWVLVFDNVDEPGLVEPFLPAARHGDVVITSRNPAWRRLARPVTVTPLARPESLAYVAARTDDRAGAADALADLLGDLPLALEQACAYIEQSGMSVPDYVALFRERRDALLLHDAVDSGPTVATTWGLAFDRLRDRSEQAIAVLETTAFLAPDAISVATLRRLVPDELDLHDALAELLRLSLVDREGGALRVHRLVQDVVRARLPLPMRRDRLREAARVCVAATGVAATGGSVGGGSEPGGSEFGGSGGGEDIAAHLVCLAGHAEALDTVPPGLVDALAALARRQAARALYPAAEHVLDVALRLHDGAADPAVHGRLVCQLGEVLDASGRVGPALELHRRAIRILDTALDPDDVVLAHAHNRLGHVLNCADDALAAIEAHQRALLTLQKAGREDLLPPVLVDLGYTLWAAGRLAPAGEAFRGSLALLKSQGRLDDRHWADTVSGLAVVEQDEGHVERAVDHLRTAVAAFTRICGPDHPDTAQALDKLGYALRLQGRAGEAVRVHLHAVRLLERVLGPDDSRVAMTLTNLGLAYALDRRLDEAADAQARARRVLHVALGSTHASTLLAGRRLAVVLAEAGHVTRARTVMREVLESAALRGAGHPAERARIAADAALVFGPAPGLTNSPT